MVEMMQRLLDETTLEATEREMAILTPRLDEDVIDRLTKKNSRQRLGDRTRKRYKAIVIDFNQFLTENDLSVNTESLIRYFDVISQRMRPATLNLHKSALLKCVKAQLGENNILKYMAIEKAFEQIALYKPDKSVPQALCVTEDKLKAMIHSAQSKKTALIIQFLYKTGCRISEMTNVRLTDCERVKGSIRIRLLGKGKKERWTSIPDALYREIRQEYGGVTWLFESWGGNPLDRSNIAHQLQHAGRRVGIDNFHAHLLRHSRATDMLKNKGVSLKAVSKFLGHANVATTAEMYVHDEVDYQMLWSQDSI